MLRFVLTLLAAAGAMSATACNTVRGAGDDLESVADAADKEI